MLVYGDRSRTVEPRRALSAVADLLAGQDRDLLTRALIETGELAQGLADLEAQALGHDDPSDTQAAAMALAVAIAQRLREDRRGAAALDLLAALRDRPLPPAVQCRTPEGYAFYAVYPDAYARAAAEHDWGARPLVIGLRSIGVSLAAMVAAATGGEAVTLRPMGPAFRRQVRISDRMRARLAAHRGPFAVVDEGPGLSGSSFGCVADLLEAMGVAEHRIIFMPSHAGGLGPHASARHRARWARARRLVRTLDDLMASNPAAAWFADQVGPATSWADLSAGAWRSSWREALRPPAIPGLERRKFRLVTRSGAYVARFAGLGAEGAAKLERARVLHAHGFGPEPIALRHGFLLERWAAGGRLGAGLDRPAFLRGLANYLALRDARFPASAEEGAGLPALREMAAVNATELCGPAIAEAVERLLSRLESRRPELRPIHVDARLHAWEWRLGRRSFCKLDGLDHSCGHDLIGAQPVAWDVAGAAIEFDLTPAETLEIGGRLRVDPMHLAPMMAAYAAFQGALWSSAPVGASPHDLERLEARRQVYRAALMRLASGC